MPFPASREEACDFVSCLDALLSRNATVKAAL